MTFCVKVQLQPDKSLDSIPQVKTVGKHDSVVTSKYFSFPFDDVEKVVSTNILSKTRFIDLKTGVLVL